MSLKQPLHFQRSPALVDRTILRPAITAHFLFCVFSSGTSSEDTGFIVLHSPQVHRHSIRFSPIFSVVVLMGVSLHRLFSSMNASIRPPHAFYFGSAYLNQTYHSAFEYTNVHAPIMISISAICIPMTP